MDCPFSYFKNVYIKKIELAYNLCNNLKLTNQLLLPIDCNNIELPEFQRKGPILVSWIRICIILHCELFRWQEILSNFIFMRFTSFIH